MGSILIQTELHSPAASTRIWTGFTKIGKIQLSNMKLIYSNFLLHFLFSTLKFIGVYRLVDANGSFRKSQNGYIMCIYVFMITSKDHEALTVKKLCDLYTEVTTAYVKADGTKGSKPVAKPGEPILKEIDNLGQAIGKYATANVVAPPFQ